MVATLGLLIVLQSTNLWKDFTIRSSSDLLLLYALSSLNFVAFVIFAFIFLRSIIKLARERRTFELGAKIKTRLLIYFVALSLLPIIAMAVFSYLFMNRALERWFTQIPVNVINEARDVQQQSIIDRAERLDSTARMLASAFDRGMPTQSELEQVARVGEIAYLEIIGPDGKSLAVYRDQNNPASESLRSAFAASRSVQRIEPVMVEGAIYEGAWADMGGGRRLIVVPNALGERSVSQMVENSVLEFERLKQQQITVRQVGLLTLGVLTFLLIFASSWIAFHVARGLTAPIKALAEGADEIGRGNFGHRVDVFAEDELAILVAAFNDMSATLEANSAELLERRRYIETVVATLPNGVISFDRDGKVGTINKAASKILRLEDGDFTGSSLEAIVSERNRVPIERLLARARRAGNAADHATIFRESIDGHDPSESEMPAALTAASLPDGNGVVLVIEDLSELISAQRASAWQEVARRMAHEIKNPLTPIQLSAERIAKRFGVEDNGDSTDISFAPNTDERLRAVVADGTATIIREVQSLKSMVDEFSRFARLPEVVLKPGDLTAIIDETVSLYSGRKREIEIAVERSGDLPEVMIDGEQIKRVFVNLIDNAIEARGDELCKVTIATRHDAARDIVVAEVADNGTGIDPADLQKLFQPYFSTKGRGTGLGLAIVNRIIAEHRGKIYAGNSSDAGAKFTIELPIADNT
jgi:two-component system, NtrC family, nitrogen regulation sensor histidine kinase NtrY